jgi:hypothetical protein
MHRMGYCLGMRTRAGREIEFESWRTEHGTLVVEARSGKETVGSLWVTGSQGGGCPYVDMVSVVPGWKHEGVATLLCWKAATLVYAEGHTSLGMPDCQSPGGWGLFRKFRGLMVRRHGSRKIFDLCSLQQWLQEPDRLMSSASTSKSACKPEGSCQMGTKGVVSDHLPLPPNSISTGRKVS